MNINITNNKFQILFYSLCFLKPKGIEDNLQCLLEYSSLNKPFSEYLFHRTLPDSSNQEF